MKIFLLNPNISRDERYIREGRCMQKADSWAAVWPPISLGVLAAIAGKKGEVRLLDCNVEYLSLPQLIDNIKEFRPDLIVVNTGFPSIEDDMTVASKIKETIPSVKIAAFGVYFTLLGRNGMERYPFLDFCLIGEPEETFEELIEALVKNDSDFSNIKGLGYRKDNEVIINSKRDYISDLDRLPFPARDMMKNDLYRLPHNNRVFTLLNAGRGCPHQCIFCIVKGYYGERIRKHSIDYIIAEIKECMTVHKISEFLFWEEVFTLDRDHCIRLCKAIMENNLKINWAATTRVDCVDDELLEIMKKSGCYLLGLGIESADQGILDNAKKRVTIRQIEDAVRLCKKNKIKTMGHFIFGLPGETKETADETITFMLKLGLDYMQCYCAVPYPGTELWEIAANNNWIVERDWHKYDFGGDSIMNLPTISTSEVTAIRAKAFRKFYFRPLFLTKTVLRDLRSAKAAQLLKFTNWMNLKRTRASR